MGKRAVTDGHARRRRRPVRCMDVCCLRFVIFLQTKSIHFIKIFYFEEQTDVSIFNKQFNS